LSALAAQIQHLPSLSEVRAERCRRSLAQFVRRVFEMVDPGAVYLHNWHIDLICEYLEAMTLGEIRNLIINIPPRFLKSIICSVAWPAWLLGRNPSEQILCGSYNDDLALKHSIDCLMVIRSPWYQEIFPGVQIVKDDQRKFDTSARGFRHAITPRGTGLGKGGNYQVLDDPLNPKLAMSDTERNWINNVWIGQTLGSRWNNPKTGHRLLIMQRLHMDDPTAFLLAKGGYELLKVPQEPAARTTITFPRSGRTLTREPGELIHPERMGPEEIAYAKVELGTYGYAGQHQQEPTPLGGGRLKLAWFLRYSALPAQPDETVISLDTAGKGKEINNPSCALVAVRKDAHWSITKMWLEHATYPVLKRAIYSLYQDTRADAVLIENKSSGQSLLDDIKEDTKTDMPVIGIEPEADKITRLDTQLAWIEAGNMSLPDPTQVHAPWLADLEVNLAHYPNPVLWDPLDALSQLIKWIRFRDRAFASVSQVQVVGI